MLEGMKNSAPRVMDPLGRLCHEGYDVATYLYQVPDDAAQWERLSRIINKILELSADSRRRELPNIAEELRSVLKDPPSMQAADQMVTGFDRMMKLWKAARSGLMDAEALRRLSSESRSTE